MLPLPSGGQPHRHCCERFECSRFSYFRHFTRCVGIRLPPRPCACSHGPATRSCHQLVMHQSMARAAQASANIITFLISVGLISGGAGIIIAPVAVTVVSSLVNLIRVRALIICRLRSTCTTDRRLDSIPELRSIHRRHITASIDRECIGGPER